MKNSGITLVALVITIIVLLIITGISLNLILGENGILSNAQNAKLKNEEENLKEEISMGMSALDIEYYYKASASGITIDSIYNTNNLAKYLSGTLNGFIYNQGGISYIYYTNRNGEAYTIQVKDSEVYSIAGGINAVPGKVTSISMQGNKINLGNGEENASYSSSDTNILEVDENGNVTRKNNGDAIITKVTIEENGDEKIEEYNFTEDINKIGIIETDEIKVGRIASKNCTINNEESNYSYKNPIIPKGFKAVNTQVARWNYSNGVVEGWNSGLTIEDEKGNQFIWVPIYDTTFFKNYTSYQTKTYIFIQNVESYGTSVNTNDTILKYQGAYVSRYEAGIPESETNLLNNKSLRNTSSVTPELKRNLVPWNNISWQNAYTISTNMYSSDEYGVTSGLPTRLQSYALLMWAVQCGINVLDQNFIDHGNLKPSQISLDLIPRVSNDGGVSWFDKLEKNKGEEYILRTGASSSLSINNLYDFAGNLSEYLDNANTEGKISHSGESYLDSNISRSDEYQYTKEQFSDSVGFRITLMIK